MLKKQVATCWFAHRIACAQGDAVARLSLLVLSQGVRGALALGLRNRRVLSLLVHALGALGCGKLDPPTAGAYLRLVLHPTPTGDFAFRPPADQLAAVFDVALAAPRCRAPRWHPLAAQEIICGMARSRAAPRGFAEAVAQHTDWTPGEPNVGLLHEHLANPNDKAGRVGKRLHELCECWLPEAVIARFVKHAFEQPPTLWARYDAPCVQSVLRALVKSGHRDAAHEAVRAPCARCSADAWFCQCSCCARARGHRTIAQAALAGSEQTAASLAVPQGHHADAVLLDALTPRHHAQALLDRAVELAQQGARVDWVPYGSAALEHFRYVKPLATAVHKHHVTVANIIDCTNMLWAIAAAAAHSDLELHEVAMDYQNRVRSLLGITFTEETMPGDFLAMLPGEADEGVDDESGSLLFEPEEQDFDGDVQENVLARWGSPWSPRADAVAAHRSELQMSRPPESPSDHFRKDAVFEGNPFGVGIRGAAQGDAQPSSARRWRERFVQENAERRAAKFRARNERALGGVYGAQSAEGWPKSDRFTSGRASWVRPADQDYWVATQHEQQATLAAVRRRAYILPQIAFSIARLSHQQYAVRASIVSWALHHVECAPPLPACLRAMSKYPVSACHCLHAPHQRAFPRPATILNCFARQRACLPVVLFLTKTNHSALQSHQAEANRHHESHVGGVHARRALRRHALLAVRRAQAPRLPRTLAREGDRFGALLARRPRPQPRHCRDRQHARTPRAQRHRAAHGRARRRPCARRRRPRRRGHAAAALPRQRALRCRILQPHARACRARGPRAPRRRAPRPGTRARAAYVLLRSLLCCKASVACRFCPQSALITCSHQHDCVPGSGAR
jgi:hypothetical protein